LAGQLLLELSRRRRFKYAAQPLQVTLEESVLKLCTATLSALLTALALSTASCGSMRRVGKDIAVTVASPVIILYGAATDSVGTAEQARASLGGGPVMQTLTLPFAFLWRGFVHTLQCGAHAVDTLFFPIYGLADLHPYGPEVRPLDFYTGTWFDREEDRPSGTDPQSGDEGEGLGLVKR
jgi:hypothetical protein